MKIGVFDLSFEEYSAAHGVSQSALKRLARSPAHLKHYVEHPEPSTSFQIIGQATHCAVFEPDSFENKFWIRPANYQNDKSEWKKWNSNAKQCRDWIAAHEDRPVIKQDAFTEVLSIRDAVHAHPAASLALKTGEAEQSVFAEDSETGLQLKGRPDWLSGNAIVDLKTCQDASPMGFPKTVAQYALEIQAAFYLDICHTLGLGAEHFILIAVESSAPYAVGVYELDSRALEVGRNKYRRLLAKYMECVSTDRWPAYSANIEYLSLPAWAEKADFRAMQLEDSPQMPALEIS